MDLLNALVTAWLLVTSALSFVTTPPTSEPLVVQEVHAAETDAMVPGP